MKRPKIKRGDVVRITWKDSKNGQILRPKIVVFSVMDSDLVGIDPKTGFWYATYWDPPSGNTPGQREKYDFQIWQRHWKRWPRGLYSFAHGINLALIGSTEIYVPRYEELWQLCAEINAELETFNLMELTEITELENQIKLIETRIQSATSPEIKEAQEKIAFCVLVHNPERLNPFKLYIVRARLSAITRRFLERIKNFAGWQPKYAARLQLSQIAQRAAQQMLQEMKNTVIHLLESQPRIEKNPTLFINRLKRLQTLLAKWQNIQPFVRWIAFTLADVNYLIEKLGQNQTKEALQRLELVLHSIIFKQIQPELEDLILDIETGLASHEPLTAKQIIGQLQDIKRRNNQINDQGWQLPLVGMVCQWSSLAGDLISAGKIRKALTILKQVSAQM